MFLQGSLLIPLAAQSFLNGGFERHDFEVCGANLSNTTFNANVPDITAYGLKSEVDILSEPCGAGFPAEGMYFAALNHNNTTDELTFALDQPLEAEEVYFVRFAARLAADTMDQTAQVEVGLSNLPDEFGTLVYTSSAVKLWWSYVELRIVPAQSTSFISVRIEAQRDAWVLVDDFSFFCPEISLWPDTLICAGETLSLDGSGLYENLHWSTGEQSPSISITEPGTYWLEAREGECVARDSMRLRVQDCECPVFFANIFSPNGDEVNDRFGPMTACEGLFEVFDLQVYDRWGKRIFSSQNPGILWEGKADARAAAAGHYAFVFRYRYTFEDVLRTRKGSVMLVR